MLPFLTIQLQGSASETALQMSYTSEQLSARSDFVVEPETVNTLLAVLRDFADGSTPRFSWQTNPANPMGYCKVVVTRLDSGKALLEACVYGERLLLEGRDVQSGGHGFFTIEPGQVDAATMQLAAAINEHRGQIVFESAGTFVY